MQRERFEHLRKDADAAIVFDDLTLGYDRHPAVHHLSLAIPRGSLVGVVGPNGAGKSTLLKAIAGQLRPMSGQVMGLGGLRIAWLAQQSAVDRSFPISVSDFVALGLWDRVGALGRLGQAERDAIAAAMSAVGLGGFERRNLDTLSGGQWQRALFARLIVQDADLILLDEPFAAVDQRTTDDLLALIHRWHAQQRTVIAVVHDLDQVRAHFPLALLLARGLARFGPTAQVLTDHHWHEALCLREAFDEQAEVCEGRTEAAHP